MKTIFFFLNNVPVSTTAHFVFRSYFNPLLFAILTLCSCSEDDEDFNTDAAKIVGAYTVTDTDKDGDAETYSIIITQSKDGGIEVSNFGDIMYVPVKATIKGNTFNVPSQTFDGIVLEHSCVASKSV